MNISNELLRSTYQVVIREGRETNWSALKENLKTELLKQCGLPTNTQDEQLILRATCTPKTFQLPSSEVVS